ncbi:uncharacterized protein Z519_04350 [Cladophialophora bantiana CBS 173.52]|uniref:MARVEL domain-containing protein n=2 Tax=Cladophialophora TaxID=82105 RepID=A0A0D2IC56_CLAB1|nr:uncharacterized protein Z519_04350 [Cladophialophora bantiana CBS 173.52]KIW94374.1 hypothetical protein Z519_04350 [Cladophialophora bantiana CBS 173.52]
MGVGSQVASFCLRIGEVICAAIVAGILGYYLHLLDDANAHANGRIIYTQVIAGISILAALVFMPPLKYSFWAFPLDFALFICWIVSFGLLVDLTSSGGCHSRWYWTSWGYYWGGWYRTIPITNANQTIIGTVNCSTWRTSNAFIFIGAFLWLGSGLCGLYVCTRDRHVHREKVSRPEVRTTEA